MCAITPAASSDNHSWCTCHSFTKNTSKRNSLVWYCITQFSINQMLYGSTTPKCPRICKPPQTCLMNWKFSMLKTDYCKSEWPQFLFSVQAQSLKFSSSLWNSRAVRMSINRENLGTPRAKHFRWSLHRETQTGKISLHQLGCEQKRARWKNESLNQLFANLPVVDTESYPLRPSNQREYSLYKDKESRHCRNNK